MAVAFWCVATLCYKFVPAAAPVIAPPVIASPSVIVPYLSLIRHLITPSFLCQLLIPCVLLSGLEPLSTFILLVSENLLTLDTHLH